MDKIPTTVITGSLGAGKTTILINLIKQLPTGYKTMWLKNEYGDVNVDSELAKESGIKTTEIMNGCVCCVLVGKLHDALEEIVQKYKLDRLFIETAGTAYPYPIIEQVNSVKGLKLDGLINVVDVLNFEKLNDKSVMAKQQAKYVDLIILNKVEQVDSKKLDYVEEEIYEVYPDTPKINSEKGFVNKDLILGIDKKSVKIENTLHNNKEHTNHSDEVEVFSFEFENNKVFNQKSLEELLHTLNPSDYYRIKGIIKFKDSYKLLNYVFGKITFDELKDYKGNSKITFMGKGIKGFKSTIHNKLIIL